MAAAALAPIGAKWDRSDAIALARPACTLCAGRGMMCPRARPSRPCTCVLRAIFRACLERYRNFHARPAEGMRWGWKHLDYCADFELAARRELDALDYQVFRLHFLEACEWGPCARRLKLSKGNFFHAVYRVEERLGRCFRELRPYGLWPLDLYFHNGAKSANAS